MWTDPKNKSLEEWEQEILELNGDEEFALKPVSYTHLDVYKRQVPH